MKKLLKSLAFLAVATMAGTAWADSWGYYGTDRSWIAIDTGAGPVAYNLDGTASPSFQGADLGEIPAGGSLIIVSYDTKTWKNNADISACEYFVKLDDGQDFSIGGGWMADLSWSDQKWGNGDVYLDVAEGLSPGPHTLSIHGRITGNPDPSGNIWEPSETTYYTANFTIAEPTKTVTFDGNGDNVEGVPEPLECVVGGVYKEGGIPSPTRANYRFRGWFTDPDDGEGERIRGYMIVEDAEPMTLWAHWEHMRQTVTFDANDGGAGAELLKSTAKFDCGGEYSGAVFTMKGATWANHKFLGWYDQPEGGELVSWGSTVSGDTTRTLYAHWRVYRQTVTFDANDGGAGAILVKTTAKFDQGGEYSGAVFSMTAATWDGHKFLGWFPVQKGGDRVKWGDTVTSEDSRTLYAHWRVAAAPLAITGFSFASKTANGKRDASPLLSEDFSGFETTSTTDVSSKLDTYLTGTGWTGSKVYPNSGSAKLGSGSANGWIATPAIDLPAGATISCKITKYSTDTGTVTIDLSTDGGSNWSTLGDAISPTSDGATYERTVTSATTGAKIRFMSSTKRFYLDDIVVTAGSSSEPTVTLVLDPDVEKIAVGDALVISATADGFSDNDAVTWSWTGAGDPDGADFLLDTAEAGVKTVTATATLDTQTASASATIKVCTPHAINVTANDHGYAEADADEAIEGTEVTVSYLADDGYALDTITLNGTPIDGTTFEMPDAVANVAVTFKECVVYTLVESADDFVVGADYVIVASGNGFTDALKNAANGSRIGIEEVTVSADGKTIENPSDTVIWRINAGSAANQLVLFNAAENVYAAAPSSAGNNAQLLSDGSAALAQWTIDLSDLPAVKIYSASYTDRYLQRNNNVGNKYFATYSSVQATPHLYRAPSAAQTKTVTFHANGDNVDMPIETLECTVGGVYKVGGIPSPTRANYRFRGWFTDPDDGEGERIRGYMTVEDAEPMDLWAHWEHVRQTVTFDANDGGAGAELLKSTAKFDCGGEYSGAVFTMKGATWANHKFLGWYDQPEGGELVGWGSTVSGDTTRTLYAHWRVYRQTVTFDANDGGAGAILVKTTAKFDQGGEYTGAVFSMTAATWDGHKFLGWFPVQKGGDRVKWGDTVTSEDTRTLYAHWRETAASMSISGFAMATRAAAPAARSAAGSDTVECTLVFETYAGVDYEVQWTSSLTGEWTVLKRWTATTDGQTPVTVEIPADAATGFFRFVELAWE